jgi:hypothetical protein
MATATSTTSTTRPAESNLDRLDRLDLEVHQFKALVKEPTWLVNALLYSLQKRHTSPAGAQAVILCGVLGSMVREIPEFQPAEPLA